ncbi:hypothetical protein BDY21DRAFT_317723 [Lineolata rhizophorae]|uniref:SPIN90/Ldb17 leucine-rich domain-containing protein n=1 Tax=Lineolata rhizophorae TaxID=578093 RepID=A0A6A6P6G3_9PEZI|nr:hypothetical protein BDY21DRAFT_317723 [Lineolata rhizophorae]
MELDVSYSLENEQQFWDELEDIVTKKCDSHEVIDNALRTYLHFTTNFRDQYLQSEDDVLRCTFKLLEACLYADHKEYVRRQLVYCLLQEDDPPTLHIITAFLLFDGIHHDETFEMMQTEGAFPRLIELIQSPNLNSDFRLHRLLLRLLYEMSRIQPLTWEDLVAVDDAFVLHLFQIIEQLSDDVNDPYHYPVIRVLLVLNEQYMVMSTASSQPLTNRVIKALSTHGHLYKTFGENLILLLNRESETSLQLLILKLLYLLFQSPSTAEYFYTNDLHVLLDVVVRNLLDLPADSAPATALRHTYLRVLHPLLANSQIAKEGAHYKRDEVRKLLALLTDEGKLSGIHFAPVDDTTARLVRRCEAVAWLRDPKEPIADKATPQKDRARRQMLGMSVHDARQTGSSLSMAEMAAQTERPGVVAPSRGERGRDKAGGETEGEKGERAEGDVVAMVGTGTGVTAARNGGGR